MVRRLFLNILVLTLWSNIFAQINTSFLPNWYISPSITIGYTFRCGWNYGLDFTFGISNLENTIPVTTLAINAQFYIINYKSEQHRITAFNIVADNNIAQFGAGFGIISKNWGYKKVNKDKAFGISTTFNLGSGDYRIPWQGIKIFIPSASWTWSSLPYYISYQFYWRQSPIPINK
jgi:hypothetical protein